MKRSRPSNTLHIILQIFAYVYRPIYSFYRSYTELERLVIGSNISRSFDRYCTISAIAVTVVMALGAALTLFIAKRVLPIEQAVALSIAVAALLIFPASSAIVISLPGIVYKHRGAVMESKFPVFAMLLSLLLSAGYSVSQALEVMVEKYGKDIKHFLPELRLAVSYARIGVPIDEALRRVAMVTPSPSLRELLMGLASVSRVGGNPVSIVRNVIAEYLARYSIAVEKTVSTLSVVMEIYVAMAMILPLIVGIVAVLLMIYPIPGISFDLLLVLTVFVAVPLLSIGTAILIDTVVSRLRP